MDRDVERKEHESFGVIEINRITASPGVELFGSDIKSRQLICLRIKKATLERDHGLSNDFIYAGESYIDVVMSEMQFAHAITSLNHGTGTPVTINYLNNRKIEDCPQRSKMQEITNEFENRMDSINEKTDQLEASVNEKLQAKGAMKVSEKKELIKEMRSLLQDIRSNLPFMGKQFVETMDKVKTEAFSEIEAYNSNMLVQMGREALESGVGRESQEMLINPVLVESTPERPPLNTKEEGAVYGGKEAYAVTEYCKRTGLSLQAGKEAVSDYSAKLKKGEE